MPCDLNSECLNTVGSFSCNCNIGFEGDGFNCTNIDECQLTPCHANADCIDTEGSFECSCNQGFSGDGFSCIDIDECFESTDNCDINAQCINRKGINFT